MNFQQFKNRYGHRDWRNTYFTRLDRIKSDGSPYFTWQVPVTAPSGISSIEISTQFPRSKKYEPLDFIEVMNNDTVDITLIINNNEYLPIPAAGSRPVIGKKLWQIGIRNDDAAANTTLNKITVSLRREPETINDWARRQL